MNNPRNNGKKKNNTTNEGQNLSRPPRNISIGIPQPFTIRQESTSNDNEQYSEQKKNREEILDTARKLNRITTWGAGLSFIALAILGCTFYYSIRSYNLSRDQYALEMRPWIVPNSIDGDPVVGLVWGIRINYLNVGKTPATHVEFNSGISFIQPGEKFSPTYKKPEPPNAISGEVVMFPDAQPKGGEVIRTNAIDELRFSSLQNGTVRAYVYGRVCYKDVIKKKHWTTFCYQYSPINKTFLACPEHNLNRIDEGNDGDNVHCGFE